MNDKEGRKWLLQKLYDNGIKYIAYSPFYGGYVGVKETPIISGKFVEKTLGVVVKRHFAKFENGRVCFFGGGRTSWSSESNGITYIAPKYVKLAGGDDEN